MSSNPASDGRIDITGFKLVALTAMMLLAFAAAIAMPFNITGIVGSFGVTNTAAGLVATIEMGGVAASSLLFANLAPKLNPRRVYVIGIGVIISMNALTIWVPTVEILYVIRGVTGASAGAIVATVMSTAGRSTTPEATFGVINSAVGVLGMALSLILPQALKFHALAPEALALSEVDGLYFIYFIFAILALAFIRSVPVPPKTGPHEHDHEPHPPLPVMGWVALVGLGIIFFGHGTLAMFIVSVGVEQVKLSPETVGFIFMLGGFVGIVAPLIAGFVGARFKAMIPTAVIVLAVVGFAVMLAQASSPIDFYIAGPFFAMMPIAMMPIVLGALSRIDPTGRLAGSHPAFVTLGGALAPLVGGAISQPGNYAANGWMVLGCGVVGSALLYSALRAADRLRDDPEAAAVPAAGE